LPLVNIASNRISSFRNASTGVQNYASWNKMVIIALLSFSSYLSWCLFNIFM